MHARMRMCCPCPVCSDQSCRTPLSCVCVCVCVRVGWGRARGGNVGVRPSDCTTTMVVARSYSGASSSPFWPLSNVAPTLSLTTSLPFTTLLPLRGSLFALEWPACHSQGSKRHPVQAKLGQSTDKLSHIDTGSPLPRNHRPCRQQALRDSKLHTYIWQARHRDPARQLQQASSIPSPSKETQPSLPLSYSASWLPSRCRGPAQLLVTTWRACRSNFRRPPDRSPSRLRPYIWGTRSKSAFGV